ncbi:MAG: hypothetical protein IT550_15785 [Novosphingobium sp.]|jgi:hypothetical protein|nr:hypothetical protein [Novosphingobium sp.]
MSGGMIRAEIAAFDALAQRLVARARAMAEARAAARRAGAGRWRRAALLWPLFTKAFTKG